MSHPKPESNDVFAVEEHWLGGQFGAISIPFRRCFTVLHIGGLTMKLSRGLKQVVGWGGVLGAATT